MTHVQQLELACGLVKEASQLSGRRGALKRMFMMLPELAATKTIGEVASRTAPAVTSGVAKGSLLDDAKALEKGFDPKAIGRRKAVTDMTKVFTGGGNVGQAAKNIAVKAPSTISGSMQALLEFISN